MRVNTSRIKVASLALDARLQGSPVSWFAGSGATKCERPFDMHMFGYPDELLVSHGIEANAVATQRVYVRCRKCPACLKQRARMWTARAIAETRVSTRTWFGTLTLSPDRQTWAKYSALGVIERRVGDATPDEVFKQTVKVLNVELTLFLKRLRKVSPFRYLLVTEAHKSGLPHFHMLVHEFGPRLTKRDLEAKWRFGFSHWRLLDDGNPAACGYACKYLSKSALTKVRASEAYGRPTLEALTERVKLVTLHTAEAVAGVNPPVQKEGSLKGGV